MVVYLYYIFIEGPVGYVTFDFSGKYLCFGGNDVRLYKTDGWEQLKIFEDNKQAITGICFGKDSKYIATTSMDRNLRFYST